jgi:predicted aspartyl protease
LPQPELIRGGVDDLGRPFLKLDVAGFPEPVTALIDTGFNGAMIVDEYQATQMGLQISRHHRVSALLASQQSETFLLSRGRIGWLGEQPFISAFVIVETERERVVRRQEIVLGVELMLNCRLEIDFVARSLTISRLD